MHEIFLETADGYPTLYSERFGESFHNVSCGAYHESRGKFILPSELSFHAPQEELRVLEVGLGMGYVYGALLEEALQQGVPLRARTLDLSGEPLSWALEKAIFLGLFSDLTLKALRSLVRHQNWQLAEQHAAGNLVCGDARQTLQDCLEEHYDLILLDPFSPQRCPELWSEEFLMALALKLRSGGRLVTYGTSAALRSSLLRAQLQVLSIRPPTDSSLWSWGTVAFKAPHPIEPSRSSPYEKLCGRQIQHLGCRAAVPYRDFSGKDSAQEILQRREREQRISALPSTSSWKKRYATHKLTQ